MSATIISLDHYRQVRIARELDAADAEAKARRLSDRRTRMATLIRLFLRPVRTPAPLAYPVAPLPWTTNDNGPDVA